MAKTFAQFIAESKTSFSRADFPKSLANIKEVARVGEFKHFDRMIEILNRALAEGGLPNAEYKLLKDLANNFIDLALDSPEDVLNRVFRGNVGFDMYDIQGSMVYANQVAGKLKKAEGFAKKNPTGVNKIYLDWYLPIIRELAPFGEAVAALKDKAVKRVVKTDAEKAADKDAAYRAPIAKQQTVAQVHDVLKKMTDEMMPDLIKYRQELHQKEWDAVVAEAKKDPAAFYELMFSYAKFSDPDKRMKDEKKRYFNNVIASAKASIETEGANRYTGAATGSTAPTAKIKTTVSVKSIFNARAEREAKETQESFLHKNVAKLAAILERKGALKRDPKMISVHFRSGVFQGDMRIEFADGSAFTVRNKIVFKSRYNGWSGYTQFVQFPTTFHDAVLPNGKKMPGQPSEQEMVEVFPKG